jgi:hypothetical protein
MSAFKRLAVASSDRMISFYDLAGTSKTKRLYSRIENLLGVPQCLEYKSWTEAGSMKAAAKAKQDENTDDNIDENSLPTLETLLVGDDLGFIHKYDFKDPLWHYCFYKDYTKLEVREDMENEDQGDSH